jgi:hypothetical protein
VDLRERTEGGDLMMKRFMIDCFPIRGHTAVGGRLEAMTGILTGREPMYRRADATLSTSGLDIRQRFVALKKLMS